eukprot:1154675-Amorphochlora_amoeboformis.AAC.1
MTITFESVLIIQAQLETPIENGTRNAPTPAKSAGDSNPIGPSCPKKLRLEPEAKVMKRHDYISWNDYFMAVSMLSAQRSKVACLVRTQHKGA